MQPWQPPFNNSTSTTAPAGPGKPLIPTVSVALETKALQEFLQQWIVGVLNIDPTLVRPRWQLEPPNLPNGAWVAIGVHERRALGFPEQRQSPFWESHEAAAFPDGYLETQEHEELDVLASFYDWGVLGIADQMAALVRTGVHVAQNTELLQVNGMGLIACGPTIAAPEMVKERWLHRIDMHIYLRRVVIRQYPVKHLLSVPFTIVNEQGEATSGVAGPNPPTRKR